MFTIDRIYGDVEVYEVGKRQFNEFCNTLDNIILSFCRVRRNDYVVISGWSSFGHQPSYVDYEHVFRSLDSAIGFVSNMQEANLFAFLKNSFRINHGRHYEIWHIVDDDELWTGWESAVESSKTADYSDLEVPDEDFDELADDAYPFGDCWDACIDACTPSGYGDSERAETKSETIMEKVNRLGDEAQGNYDLYGGITSGPTDLCDYLGIHWDEYDELADDAKHALQDFWRKLVVWDNRYSRFCWNILIDDDMTADLLKEHYSGRIWHKDGTLRFCEC